ncbi:MAG TPA: hypothetical protein VK936_14095 [Longimicrobiales bacterium]|nr:hypothetical protein [Longimicrobiales bacterium]
MAISRTTARRLCTKPEFELVEASFAPHVKTLSPARLRQKVARTRKLRDKYRDLARRQRLEARGKRSPQRARPAQGHENTDRKATLFREVLDRFEAQLGRAEAGPATTAGARKAGAKKTGARKAGAKKTGATKAGAKKAGAKKAGARKAGPAAGKARAAKPAKAGTSAMKGARRKPERGPQDADQRARGRTARAHARSANTRSQHRRDSRG